MAYVLPIIIDNRRLHYLHATADDEDIAGDASDTFVVAMTQKVVPLFYFSEAKDIRIADEPGKTDISLRNADINCSIAEGRLRIHIRQASAHRQPPAKEAAAGVHDDEDEYEEPVAQYNGPAAAPAVTQEVGNAAGVRLRLVREGEQWRVTAQAAGPGPADSLGSLHCDVVLESLQGRHYSCDFGLHLATTAQLVQGALDFGSEASQLMESKQNLTPGMGGDDEGLVPLFQLMKAHCKLNTVKACVQQDVDANLFRSVFLLRKNLLTGDDGYNETALFLPEPKAGMDPNLIMVFEEGQLDEKSRDYYQLPNLKLLNMHANALSEFSFTWEPEGGTTLMLNSAKVLRQAYATVLRSMVQAWLPPLLSANPLTRLVRLTMLVPNIYNELEVRHAVYVLGQVLSDIKRHHKFGSRLGGWEVQTISESDAAFLGYYFKYGQGHGQRDESRYYIIVDCGKGTTDFSIIQQQGETLQPVYRSGIAGAGNLVSFAVFQAILQYIDDNNLGNKANVSGFARELTKSGPNTKLRLSEIIERLKKSHRMNADLRAISDAWGEAATDGGTTLSDIDANFQRDILVEILKKVSGVPDEKGYIQGACEFIASMTAKNLGNITAYLRKRGMSCDAVYLTGRGFLLEPLTTLMREKLSTALAIRPEKIFLPRPDECKSLAVTGVLKRSFIMQPQIIGWPVQTPDRPAAAASNPPLRPKKKFLVSRWMKKVLDDLTTEAETPADNIAPMEQITEDFNTHRFVVGNNKWQPEDPVHFWDPAMKYDLLYNPGSKDGNTRFFVRKYSRANGVKTLVGAQRLVITSKVHEEADKMVRPSLFPVILDQSVADEIIG